MTAEVHRPVHLHGRLVLLVAAGGVLGALARYGLGFVIPAPGGWPLPTLVINLSGALVLGALLEGLSRRGPDAGWRQILRLAVGTGFLGAFTTYSTLALDAVHLFDAGRSTEGVWYLGTSLLGGVAATVAGIWLAARQHRRMVRQ
ncbi:CrcB family protein [Arthrobacter sp. CJ23]|uniref:fluoride efflux transporter FluC n=1 Tax=Arthrobacter sp. CJ23 TaxID=2972479 RepID=UPI00215D1F9F|nr:CrcB family protein [Arthrobacter sp. CJ23]UVJ38471.1 CrcB family protein [Arthrobacter sp. CJ23]